MRNRTFPKQAAFKTLISVGLISFLAGCGNDRNEASEPFARPVKLHVVEPFESTLPLEFPAVVRARESVQLAFNVPGQISDLPAVEGERVIEGTILAELTKTEFQSRLESATAAFELAQTDFRRFEELGRTGAVATAEVDRRRAAFQNARADLELAQKAFDDTVLRAPFDGMVGSRLVMRFANIQAKQPIVLFHSLSPLDIVIQVPEALVLRTERERAQAVKATVRFDHVPGSAIPVTLREINTEADPVTRTYRVTFALEDRGGINILPGMSATLLVDRASLSDAPTPILLPPAAIAYSPEGLTTVWTFNVDNSTVESRVVTLGLVREDGVEILAGLEAGEQVVIAGISQLRPGLAVRPYHR